MALKKCWVVNLPQEKCGGIYKNGMLYSKTAIYSRYNRGVSKKGEKQYLECRVYFKNTKFKQREPRQKGIESYSNVYNK